MEKIALNKDTKELLDKISSLFGIKTDVIKDVWEYTLIVWLLEYANSNASLKRVPVPYLGTIGLRFNGERLSNDDKIEADIDSFIALDSNFKDLLKSVQNNSSEVVIDLIQTKIKKLSSQV